MSKKKHKRQGSKKAMTNQEIQNVFEKLELSDPKVRKFFMAYTALPEELQKKEAHWLVADTSTGSNISLEVDNA